MTAPPAPRTFDPAGPLRGSARVPGDKSISHRALILGALAIGTSTARGLLRSEDVRATARALTAMGADISVSNDVWHIRGTGIGGLLQPDGAFDMGNSGTSTRLLMGLVASHSITTTFVGDESLSRRPMGRIIAPLSEMGADIVASPGGRLPAMVRGISPAVPVRYRLPIASAQVKSAILLAALNTPGTTTVIEPEPTRDHSERMLAAAGAEIQIGDEDGERVIAVTGEADLAPQDYVIPADPSSAAFPIVAALIVPGSEVKLEGVGINPTRAGLFEVLKHMGADIWFENEREIGGEPVADVGARHSALKGIDVPPDIAPRMIDEFPILFVAAALAEGETKTSGLAELRVKESDRLALMAQGLARLGVDIEEREDGLVVRGSGGEPIGGANTAPEIASSLDHRIAMSFAVAGLASRSGVTIDDMRPVSTSFPEFEALIAELGGNR